MSCEVIVRRARDVDLKRRMELVRQGLSGYFWSAFVYFFFQELTLECCVLGAAVLFIFCGVSPALCCLVLPTAVAVVALGVSATHHALAHRQAQKIRGEVFGLVAEVCGVLLLSPGAGRLPIHIQLDFPNTSTPAYSLVIGTVSVSDVWGPSEEGWLHALVVHPEWRGRGVGCSLLAAARRISLQGPAAVGRSLRTVVSLLQPKAREALITSGWRSEGLYERPLCGAALTLPLERLLTTVPPDHYDL
ncbi:uncharacterized protein LOC116774889 isoform X1 [Danaus plexippus]|uniref:Uncharacterized protein n=1 Tax=Danaus plexippus plexippus TaxID=278856 RepID=A0A212EJ67_DANPL|nr:uncharacterized protein LOC116774889 isoform X1 [Danaus plexippus]OWR41529.1 hypothetical protein KGM_200536 [Danaus plexippus plexippus]